MMKTVFYLLIVSCLYQACEQQPLGCTTICDKGERCEEDNCLPCPPGHYMAISDHTQQFCLKWTNNPGRNVAIVKNGSSTEDVVWGCQVGYEKKNTYVGGFECLEIKNDLSTENTSTTTHMTTSTSVANITTITLLPQTEVEKTDNIKIILLGVLVPLACFVIIVVTVLIKRICYYRRERKRKQTTLDPESLTSLTPENDSNEVSLQALNRLFHKIVPVIEIQGCKKLFWYIENKSKQFSRHPTLNNVSDCYKELKNWHSLNPDIDHKKCLLEALSKLEYNFSADIRDLNDFLASIDFQEKLNKEFRKFCFELCRKLSSTDRDSLLNALQVKVLYESRLMNSKVEVAYCDCLAKWSYKYPYVPNENKDWRPLTEIQEALKDLERKDIIEELPNLIKGIHQVMISIEGRSESNAPVNNGS